jgi:plastocyanin
MDTLDSRSLRNIDCFAQMFSAPGQAYYRISMAAGSCLPVGKEGAFQININARPAGGQEGHQFNVSVHMDGHQLVAEPPSLEIEAGDTVLWNTSDPHVQGFAVQGEGPDGSFDSSAMSFSAIYTHAFGSPGEYKWFDANGSDISGTIAVRSLDWNDPEQCRKWVDSLSEGVLIRIRDDRADPSQVEIVAGQTVFWAIERAPGISITDSRMVWREMEK